jgi:aminoglycoside 6'-N-acetyltransferase
VSGPLLSLRPLQRLDLPLLATWLAEPLVARWWNHDTSSEAVERDFGPSIDGTDATEMFLGCQQHRPFGFIQRYAIAAYPEYAEELSAVCVVPLGALSVDYFIGEPDARGRGLGSLMIATFVADSLAAIPDAHHVIVPVSTANHASWRALERAGFRRIAEGRLEPDNTVDSRDHFIYGFERHTSS